MKNSKLFVALLSVVLISACESEPSTTLQDNIDQTVQPRALFDPSNSIIPFPNNLLFSGTADLTLNIPVADPLDFADPTVAINALDGFSTVAPMTTGFTTAIDSSTIAASVHVYEVTLFADISTPIAGPVIGIVSELAFGSEYFATISSVDTSQSTLAILPINKPLKPNTSYMVVVTDSLMSTDAQSFGPSPIYLLIKNLASPLVFGDPTLPGALQSLTSTELADFEKLRVLIRTGEATIDANTAITTAEIIQSWSFTTQSIGDVLTTVRSVAGTPTTSLSASTVVLGTFGAGRSPLGAANVFEGTLASVPYYLTAPTVDPTVILNNSWQALNEFPPGSGETNLTGANPLPVSTVSATIPLMVTTPFDMVTFPPPWRTVIYQHGITRQRSDMLAVADSLAAVGLATVAIDMPLHGLDSSSDFYQSGFERTFDVDLVGQDINGSIVSAGPDMTTDSSGVHFINLSNLLVSRDNLRQAVADLFALTAAIPGIDVDGGGADLDGGNVFFVGHSLGAIVGTTFVTLESNVKDAVLANGGGGIPKILDGSASFSGAIVAGLAAAGVIKGTPDYESFLGAAQTVVDSGDPVNYAEDLATIKGEGILFFEIVGDSTLSNLSDLVVPNTVPDGNDSSGTVAAPLAGTEPMLTLMGLTQINNTPTPVTNLQLSVKFTAGSHASFIDPTDNLAVTTAMQGQTADFLFNNGNSLTVSDPSTVIEVP